MENKNVNDVQNQLDKVKSSDEGRVENDKVSYDTYSRVLGKLKKTEQEMGEYRSVVQKFQEQQRLKEEEDLIKQNDFESFKSLKERELAEAQKRMSELESSLSKKDQMILNTHKLTAFYDKIPGKIKKREYLSFVPLDQIEINPETFEVDEDSLMKTVNGFMQNHGSDLVDMKKISMPSEAADPNAPGKIRYSDWVKLSRVDKDKYAIKDIID